MRKCVFATLLAIIICSQGYTQNHSLQSVFIYSFTRYVIWPESHNQGDFEILVLGEAPIIEELRKMAAAKKVGERTIKITRINSPEEIKKCNILFIPSGKSELFTDVVSKVSTQPILIITEEPGMGTKGSDINFIIKDGKLRFELNQAAVDKQNLKVANELSRLAIQI
jgi:hypothetical protein